MLTTLSQDAPERVHDITNGVPTASLASNLLLTTLSQDAPARGHVIMNGVPTASLASNLLRTKENGGLRAFFTPHNIAVIGATEKPGSIGRTIVRNLIGSPFGGTVFPVNPNRPRVLGIKAHPRIGDVPDAIDLAIVATPAPTVPDLIGECVEAGVRRPSSPRAGTGRPEPKARSSSAGSWSKRAKAGSGSSARTASG